jgi:hypothetical protein
MRAFAIKNCSEMNQNFKNIRRHGSSLEGSSRPGSLGAD